MYHKRRRNTVLRGAVVVMVFALITAFALLIGSIGNFNDTSYTVTVTDKERTGGDDSKYLIFGEDEKGTSYVFENTDTLYRGKWNSSNMYGKIKIGDTYKFTVVGYRIPFLSCYQNIIEMQEIEE